MEAVTRTLLPDAAKLPAGRHRLPFRLPPVRWLSFFFAALAWLYATILRNTDESSETALSPGQALYYRSGRWHVPYGGAFRAKVARLMHRRKGNTP